MPKVYSVSVGLLLLALAGVPCTAAPKPISIPVLAQDFEFQGDWAARSDLKIPALVAEEGRLPAATAVQIPRAGKYRLWICSRDFPQDRPGTRTFHVRLGSQVSARTFGTSGQSGYTWEDGGWFDLPAGPLLLSLEDQRPFARAQGLLLTADPNLVPVKWVGRGGLTPVKPLPLEAGKGPAAGEEIRITSDRPAASLANDELKIDFLHATRGDTPSIATRVWLKSGADWVDAGADAAAEGYFAVLADSGVRIRYPGFYPVWPRESKPKVVTVSAGGSSVATIPGKITGALWQAGARTRFVPVSAMQEGDAVRIEFAPSPAGTLEAKWELLPGQKFATVTLTFVPTADGQATLGYELFFRRELEKVNEVLLPFMWHRHRLPPHPTTLLDNCTPTPISLAEPTHEPGQPARCFAIVADPAGIPFAWPNGKHTHFGLSVSDEASQVHPSIWGPVMGTDGAAIKAGQPIRLSFHVLVQVGDWYAGYRTAADQIDGLRDYRQNTQVSLTDAAYNMIDLIMDDAHGGWWDRAKAFYQIETKNGGTQASPMTLLSLYRLTGNEDLYRTRALPTLEFMLSRELPHFSPVPGDTGPYPAGSMNGPVKFFGTSTFAGLFELTGRRTPAFAQIALPPNDVRPTAGSSHAQPFDEWVSRFLLTNDKKDLDRACELADQYIKKQIQTPPGKDLGPDPFFYISFVPDWEGLLRLCEVTGRQEYLDAATFGARQLMTGIWTQPLIPPGDATIHPGGEFVGDATHEWWRGSERYRLGWPPKPGEIREKSVPAWEVSNVGLGFEQPITFNPSGPARQIFEEAWAPHFLRLYRYTKDPAFLTYARNAIVGRWGNYPGYYAVGQSDLEQSPTYPLTGPDVSDIYYHHIPAHLAWTIDYLVTEAEVLSDGKISFPALRQHGYAYFDSRIFGHAPGKVFDDSDAWLVFRRDLVKLDNVQVNHVMAHSRGRFHVILTNQSREPQKVTVAFNNDALKVDPARTGQVLLRRADGSSEKLALEKGNATVELPARGLAVLTLDGVTLDIPAQRSAEARNAATSGAVVALKDPVAETRAAVIAVRAGPWDAYVWSAANPSQARAATLQYTIGEKSDAIEKKEYPFEFSIPVGDEKAEVRFHLDLVRPDGTLAPGAEATLKREE
ncbi:MAG TPA: hypothetical protein VLJ39_03670 [Tepidisphaeraceae bacterium]|nr:hypothetical protein [Tepidisphaeraceae bacterium]